MLDSSPKTPMDILSEMNDRLKKQGENIKKKNDERPKRLFSDVLKNIDKGMHDSAIFKSGDGYNSIEKLLKTSKLPFSSEDTSTTIEVFDKLDKVLTEDPKWDTFWNSLKNEFDNEEIHNLKEDVLNAYRFKLLSNAQTSISLSNSPAEIKENSKAINVVLQSINGIYTSDNKDNKEGVYNEVKMHYKNNMLAAYAQHVNGVMLKYIKDPTLDKRNLSSELQKVFDENKNLDKYYKYFDQEDALKNFNAYFSVSKIEEKINNYNETAQKVGFDINEMLSDLESFKQNDKIPSSLKKDIDDYKFVLKNLAYFQDEKLTANDDVYHNSTFEQHSKMHDQIKDKLKEPLNNYILDQKNQNGSNFGKALSIFKNLDGKIDNFNEKTVPELFSKELSASNPDYKTLAVLSVLSEKPKTTKDFKKLNKLMIAELSKPSPNLGDLIKCNPSRVLTTTEYKRSFGQALKDGFSGFPRNLGQLFKKPPRNLSQIAEIRGHTQIAQTLGFKAQVTDSGSKEPITKVPEQIELSQKEKKDISEILKVEPHLQEKLEDALSQFKPHDSINEGKIKDNLEKFESGRVQKMVHQFENGKHSPPPIPPKPSQVKINEAMKKRPKN